MIILFSGNVGTGKTALAKAAAKKFKFFYFDADTYKREVYAEDPYYKRFFELGKPVPAELRAKLYLRITAELSALKNKHPNIVIDETFHTKLGRDKLLKAGKKLFGKIYIILVKSSLQNVKARSGRKRRGHLLKKAFQVHLSIKQLASFPARPDLVVNNNSKLSTAADKISKFISKIL